jgi:hypothetical protein
MARGGAFDIARHSLLRAACWAATGATSEASNATAARERNMATPVREDVFDTLSPNSVSVMAMFDAPDRELQ